MPTKRGRAAQLDREIAQALTKGAKQQIQPSYHYKRLIINHRRIPPEDLKIAKFNASRDPAGQTFPWLPTYPLAGSTVYHAGKLWIVYASDGYGPTDLVHLQGEGHDNAASVPRDQLRPISWTQHQEDRLP